MQLMHVLLALSAGMCFPPQCQGQQHDHSHEGQSLGNWWPWTGHHPLPRSRLDDDAAACTTGMDLWRVRGEIRFRGSELHKYQANNTLICTWRIFGSVSRTLSFRFTAFMVGINKTKAFCDDTAVRVHDGARSFSFCGSPPPVAPHVCQPGSDVIVQYRLRATGKQRRPHFVLRYSSRRRMWSDNLRWRTMAHLQSPADEIQPCKGSSKVHLTKSNPTATIELRGYEYMNNCDQTWHVEAPPDKAIQARVAGVIEYELLCQFDQLSLGDQFGTCAVGDEGRQLDAACRHYAALCGTLDAGVTHTSLCNRLKVQFRSDHTITGQGFVVNLTLVDNDRRSKVETSPNCTVPELRCGHTGPRIMAPRIVGGQTARPHQFPWLALIEYNNFHICAGSVISNRWILTAAHCVINLSNPSRLRVRVGKYLRNVAETFEQVLTVEQIIVHCSYGKMTFDNDIALLKLTEDIKFTESVHPICLPYDHDVPASTQCEIAGWGYTHEGDANTESPVPRFGTVETQTNAACSAALVAQRVTVTDNMVCALARQAERSVDTCQGDSGGPLMLKVGSDGQVVQYGVVSWGIGCGRQGLPGVYTRVHKYTSWVVDVTQGCVYIHDPNIYVEGKMP